jgi:hypothetical protein
MSEADLLALYEEYFACAERANRIALPFEAWRAMLPKELTN